MLSPPDASRRRIALDDIEHILTVGLTPNATTRPAEHLGGRRCWFFLADGSEIVGPFLSVSPGPTRDQRLRVDCGFGRPVEIPLRAVAGVRFGPARDSDGETQLCARLSERRPGSDFLIVERAAKAVVLPGALERLAPDGWTFQFADRARSGSLDQAYGVIRGAGPSAPRSGTAELHCRNGSRLRTTIIAAGAERLIVEAGALGRIEIPWTAVLHIDMQSGRVVYLSDIDPADTIVRSQFGGDFPPKRDANVNGGPLALGRQTYGKGLGVHAYTALVFDLGGGFERFMADLGVDDATAGRGSVVFRILGDGRVLLETETLTGGRAPRSVSVDVSGINTLTLECDEAGDLGLSDHADWADARLIRLEMDSLR